MTDTFRALCAELTNALAEWELGGGPPEDTADAELIARARAALAAEPEPPADGEVAELVACLHRLARADWLSDETADILTRAADLLEHLVAEPEGPSDDELLKLTENISTEYLCKHKSLPSDWDPGDYASSTKGLIEFARAVLARWGNQS
jgi:hypothetical protein